MLTRGVLTVAFWVNRPLTADGFTRNWIQAEFNSREAGIALPDYFLAPHYTSFKFPAKALHGPRILGGDQATLYDLVCESRIQRSRTNN